MNIPGSEASNCYNQPDYQYSESDLPKPITQLSILPEVSENFSPSSINIANAIGVLDLINTYSSLKNEYTKSPTIERKVALLETSMAINQKINTASLEISSVASELDCEEERTSQIANYLKSRGEERENKLLISSIILGAAGSVAAEILSNQSSGNASTVVGIGTSIAEAGLGFMMLFNKQKTNFYHLRNTPAEIWIGPKVSKTLPPSIWYYLNDENPELKKISLRKQLVENWTHLGQIESNKNTTLGTDAIYFGKGGTYTSDQLKNRADMYDQIESYVTLMKQDLKQLSIEFVKLSQNP